MNVLVLSYMYPKPTDPVHGTFVHKQVKHLILNGCRVVVVSPVPWIPRLLSLKKRWGRHNGIPKKSQLDSVEIYYPKFLAFPKQIWSVYLTAISFYLSIYKSIDRIRDDFKFDLIYANTVIPDGFAALLLGKRYNVPVVCITRGELNLNLNAINKFFCKTVIKKVDAFVCVSEGLRKRAEEMYKPAQQKMKVIYNGCEIDLFKKLSCKLDLRKKFNLPLEHKILVFVGVVHRVKGIFELIKAFDSLLRHYKNIFLLMVGGGRDQNELLMEMKRLEIDGKCLITGYVPHEKIPFWLNCGDIFVLPGHLEGIPNAVREAMACELPVIASNVSGVPEIVDDGITGYLVNGKNENGWAPMIDEVDTDELISKIENLLNNEELSRDMGRRARKKIINQSSWDSNALQLIDVFRNVLQSRS